MNKKEVKELFEKEWGSKLGKDSDGCYYDDTTGDAWAGFKLALDIEKGNDNFFEKRIEKLEIKVEKLETKRGRDTPLISPQLGMAAVAEVAILKLKIVDLKEALIWCSGASDFQLDGQARVGWEKIVKEFLEGDEK